MRIELGYPDEKSERQLLMGADPRERIEAMSAAVNLVQFSELQKQVDKVSASDALLDYLQRLVHYTRTSQEFHVGLSPRGALSLLKSAKAWALLDGRSHVIPEDVQAVAVSVIAHRVRDDSGLGEQSGVPLVEILLKSVEVVV